MKARALLLASVAALLPAAVSQALADAPVEAAPHRFAPPPTPLVLTRSITRILSDGKAIVITRRYAIRFVPEGDGYRLDGEQIDAQVDAPPILSGLADIERKRIDKGLFPARLDSRGMIREGGRPETDPATRRVAVAEAERLIGKAPIAQQSKRELSAYLPQIAAAPSAVWPTFLFNPGLQERVERRRLALPGGGEGEVEVRIQATSLMPCGLPDKVERVVTTHLEGTSRVTREVWTIVPTTL